MSATQIWSTAVARDRGSGWYDRKTVAAVAGARHKRAGAQARQIILAYQPQHPLGVGVGDASLAPQSGGDPPIAVMTMRRAEPLDRIAQIGIGRRPRVRVEVAMIARARYIVELTQPPTVGSPCVSCAVMASTTE